MRLQGAYPLGPPNFRSLPEVVRVEGCQGVQSSRPGFFVTGFQAPREVRGCIPAATVGQGSIGLRFPNSRD